MARKPKDDLDPEYIRSRLEYDPSTGIFTWRRRDIIKDKWDKFFNTRYAGKVAGSKRRDGYIEIRIDGISYLAHRLAWAHHYGEWPPLDIDHKDRVTSHNWIDNLRPATVSQNLQNASIRSDNTSGVKGVFYAGDIGRWRAFVCLNGKPKHLGCFDNIEDAVMARNMAANAKYGDFATDGVRYAQGDI